MVLYLLEGIYSILGQFREMFKIPQIMGMNKQSLYSYFTSKLVSFKSRFLPVLG